MFNACARHMRNGLKDAKTGLRVDETDPHEVNNAWADWLVENGGHQWMCLTAEGGEYVVIRFDH